MADRQGFENNDFTGGLSDEYVPSKDNRLDAAENICLDDDLTPIQRPGSAKLTGADASFGKHVDQEKIKGLEENSKSLYAFNDNLAFAYNKTTQTSFVKQVPTSGVTATPDADPKTLNAPVDFSAPGTTAHTAPTPVSGGSVNTFQMRDIVYATSSKLSFPQKLFTEDTVGDTSFAVGVPRPPDQFLENPNTFTKRAENEVSLWRTQGPENPPNPAALAAALTPNLMPMNPNTPVLPDTPGSPRSDDNYGWSDKPYTYKGDGTVIKDDFTYMYQFCFVLKVTYFIDGIKYEKRSAPSTPTWFLSNYELKTTYTGVSPNRTRTTYFVGIVYSLTEINRLLRQMNLPFYDETLDQFGDPDAILQLETYMTDSTGTLFTTRKYYEPAAPVYTIKDFYARLNANTGPAAILGNYVSPAATTNDNQYQPDIFIGHERVAADTDYVSLYTQQGILAYDPPPPCKYIFAAGTYAFYLNVKELSTSADGLVVDYTFKQVKYRGKISNANDPDSVPEGNFFDLPDEITGGGSVLDRAIVGTTKEIYRIDGRYNTDGTGLVNGQILSSETGLLSHKSVVTVKDKLFFCGDDGIYMTDGVAVLCISRHLSRTYRRLIEAVASDSTGEVISIDRELAQEKISAKYDRVYDRILFSFGEYVLALEVKASRFDEAYGAFYGEWFTGLDKSTAPESFSAIGIFNDKIVRGDYAGYVYQMSPGYLSDPKTNELTSPAVWGLSPIIYRLRTAKIAFGSLVVKKWVNYVTFILKRRKVLSGGQTDIDVQVNAYNDGERIRQTLKPAHYFGTRDNVFDENPKSGGIAVPKVITDTLVNFQRRFGSSGLRCITKAIEFTNGMHLVSKSDDVQQGFVATNFVSLPGYPTYQWPKEAQDLDQVGYAIAFDTDNYQTKYLVTAATAATLTLGSAPAAGLHKWKLYSFSTKQFFGLHSLGLIYTSFGSKHSDYLVAEQGGNTGDAGE